MVQFPHNPLHEFTSVCWIDFANCVRAMHSTLRVTEFPRLSKASFAALLSSKISGIPSLTPVKPFRPAFHWHDLADLMAFAIVIT